MLLLLTFTLALSGFLPAQTPEARSSAPEPEVLSRIEEMRRAGKAYAAQLWPGWDPSATPVALYRPNQLTVLAGHPHPPPAFRPYATPLVSTSVSVANSTEGFMLANTAQRYGGTLTSFIGYEAFMQKDREDAVALGIHELFHAQQLRVMPNKQANILVVLWGQYPEFSARNRALLAEEGQALLGAIHAGDGSELRRHAADFLGLRALRRKDLTSEAARYEAAEESHEGLAQYMEYRLLEVAYPAKSEAREKRLKRLESINQVEHDRDKFYSLGMAEAILLDRLRPGWKRELESSDGFLDDLLARAVPASTAVRDLSGEVRAQEKELAAREENNSRRIGALLARGRRVMVEVGAARSKVNLRGINPNGSLQVTPDLIWHSFLLLDLAGMKMDFTGIPAIYDKAQEAFWIILPAEVVDRALERFEQNPEKLEFKSAGFSGEFRNIEVARRAGEVRIRPAVDLERAKPQPKPEFVKP